MFTACTSVRLSLEVLSPCSLENSCGGDSFAFRLDDSVVVAMRGGTGGGTFLCCRNAASPPLNDIASIAA